MSDIISLASGRKYSIGQLLEILDDLRTEIANGNVVAFAAVGVGPDHRVAGQWRGATRVIPPLVITGAIAIMQHQHIDETET